ncbi:MAG: MFS transporter, partial [bacterium]|nr:MFS transporter [bacterium]
VLPFALLADAIDYDEQLTGQRREAIFFGLQGVVQKLMIGISALTFGFIVYEGDVVTVTGLRTVAAAAAVSAVIAFAIFLTYPLRERDGKVVLKNAA